MYKEALFFTLYEPLLVLLEQHDKADLGSPLYHKINEDIITLCKDVRETVTLESISDKLLRSYKDQVTPDLWPEHTTSGWYFTKWSSGVSIPFGPFDTEVEAFETLIGEGYD